MNYTLVGGLAFSLFGILMFGMAVRRFKKAVASLSWPKVQGELTEVELWGKRNIDGEMKDADHLRVAYQYQVNGSSYTGSNASYYTMVYPETKQLADRLSPGMKVDVHYHPKEPGESVLKAGPNESKRYSDLILGALGVVIGVTITVYGFLSS